MGDIVAAVAKNAGGVVAIFGIRVTRSLLSEKLDFDSKDHWDELEDSVMDSFGMEDWLKDFLRMGRE